MRGRTNAAAAGGGAEPVYGLLDSSQVNITEDEITLTFPTEIGQLVGLTLMYNKTTVGYRVVSYPAGVGFATIRPDETRMAYYTASLASGNIARISFASRLFTVNGNTVTIETGDTEIENIPMCAYYYVPA